VIILDLQTKGRRRLVGLQQTYTKLIAEVVRRTAEHWHRELFPRHFGARNASKYRLEPRTQFYLRKIKQAAGVGEGRFRLLVLTGQSQRALRNLVRITGTGKRATVRMTAPSYFDRPKLGSYTDPRTGQRKTITRQPNKPDEVTRVDPEDARDLREFAARRLQNALDLNDRLS
jgi:hypothetical protein